MKYSTQSHRTSHEKVCKFPQPEEGLKKLKAEKNEDLFKCSNCQKKFHHNCSVYRHQKEGCRKYRFSRGCTPKVIMSPKRSKTFDCKQCSGKFDRKVKLLEHMERKHSNAIIYQYNSCKKVYKRIDHFINIGWCVLLKDEPLEMWSEDEAVVPGSPEYEDYAYMQS